MNQQADNEKFHDFIIYTDEETIVSRNFLLFLEERFSLNTPKSSESTNDSNNPDNTTNTNTKNNIITNNQTRTIYKPADKLIIKAKVYILEILEVI